MHDPTPVANAWIWLREIAGVLIVLVLPGYLVLGRHLPRRDGGWLAASLVGGLLLVPIGARVLTLVHAPFTPLSYLVFAGLLTAASWRSSTLAELVREAWSPSCSSRATRGSVAATCLATLVGTIVVFWGFSAPPHLHDASNHAFLVRRIVETRSTDLSMIFGPPHGAPAALYLPGWHASAALVAQLGGVAPYVSAWLLPLIALALLPWTLHVLWKSWGFSDSAVAVGALLLLANEAVPLGVLGWGGFSAATGMLLVPMAATLLVATFRRPSVLSTLVAGAALGSLAHVQGAGAVAAMLLGGVGLVRERIRPSPWVVGAILLVVTVLVGTASLELSQGYQGLRMNPPREVTSLGRSLNGWLNALGRWDPLKLILGLGLILGWRRHRAMVVTSLLLAGLFCALSSLRDPISLMLTKPFYQEPSRVRALQMYLLPPLAALPVAWLLDRGRSRRWLGRALMMLAVAILVGPGSARTFASLRESRRHVPFDALDHRLALDLRDVVSPGEWIANHRNDGSIWLSQVSGRDFVVPTAWTLVREDGFSGRLASQWLLERPWMDEVWRLRERDVHYLLVSDTHLESGASGPPSRHDLKDDPRFALVLESDSTSLYRILWGAGR